MKTALFIGRFQPFHRGHLSVVQRTLKEAENLVIGIGSSQENGTANNPYTFEERRDMILAALKDHSIDTSRITIIAIPDIDDAAHWVDHVIQLVPPFEGVYTGSPIVRNLFKKHGGHKTHEVHLDHDICATDIRHAIKNKKSWQEKVPRSVAQFVKANPPQIR